MLPSRTTETLPPESTDEVEWVVCAPEDEPALEPWDRGVGPAVLKPIPAVAAGTSGPGDSPTDRGPGLGTDLALVCWNMRVGGGDPDALMGFLREANLFGVQGAPPLVLVLQEVFRRGGGVPKALPTGAKGAGGIGDFPPGKTIDERVDVGAFAESFGLSYCYAPSMRNGHEVSGHPEDRGNALMSTLPLSHAQALVLPFERQRRVAVAAAVEVGGVAVSIASIHLDNRAPWRRAWRSLGVGRGRQMKGLLAHYPSHQGPAVLAGDFNTWVREHREPAYTEARRVFPHPRSNDPGPTHHFELGGVLRRSDHMMARLPDGWTMTVERGPETFGSDHFPLIGRLSLRS